MISAGQQTSVGHAGLVVNASSWPEQLPGLLVELQLLLDAGAPDAAGMFEGALSQLERIPSSRASKDLVECLLVVAKYYYLMGDPALAVRSASVAVVNARALEDKHLLRKAYTYRGTMRVEAGDTSGSLEDCLDALRFARELQQPGLERPAWNNIGIALMQAGQYSEAVPCLERASVGPRVSQNPSDDYGNAIPYENIASCAIFTRDLRRGLDAAMTAIRLNPSPAAADACLGRVTAESNLARLLIQVGDLARAEVHSQTARAFASNYPTNRASFIAENASGLVDIHRGRIDKGIARLNASLNQVRQSFPGQLHDALTVCAAGFEAAGKPDAALECLQELLEFNRERRIDEITRFRLLSQEVAVHVRGPMAIASDVLGEETTRLHMQIEARVQQLVHTAVSAGVASGYDLYRVFRVSRIATGFAEALRWPVEQRNRVTLAAKLYDVGMIAMPVPLLAKSSALSPFEQKLKSEHTRIGADLLAAASVEILESCIPVARFHHERWDGSGPWAMRRDAIPLEARLIALCDAFDALTHSRPWRPRMTLHEALAELERSAGSQFDPELAVRFVSYVQELYRREGDLENFLAGEAKENSFVRAREQIAAMLA